MKRIEEDKERGKSGPMKMANEREKMRWKKRGVTAERLVG